MADPTVCLNPQPRNAVARGEDLADKLKDCARHAIALEGILMDVRAIFEAIDHGDLLTVLPADLDDAHRHNIASSLLDIARRRLDDGEAIPGTDLSIKLRVIASDVRKMAS